MEKKLPEQERIRREKLEKYEELNIDPFGQRFLKTDNTDSIKKKAENKTKEELEEANIHVVTAGRIMFLRKMGKASFFTIQDQQGRIQAFIRRDNVGEEQYNLFKLADIGDIVGLEGTIMRTNTDEVTVRVDKYTHLVKALRPLPEKFHGLTDVEERYRRRYVDLIMNEDAKRVALLRPKIIRAIQKYFDERGFIEVETSMLNSVLGGAAARPFITHHNTLDRDFYLRIATELPLKRLLVGGIERVYEIGRLFRNEGMDTKHNPEFTTIEAYQAYGNIDDMYELCEGLIRSLALQINESGIMPWGEHVIDINVPFRKVHMVELVKEATGIDFFEDISFEEAKKIAKEHDIEVLKHWSGTGHIINALFEKYCEDGLIQPTFVYGHPTEISPLAKTGKDPRFADRFELFICGSEIANAFTELNNPLIQEAHFAAQLEARAKGDEEASEMDEDFLEALQYGMPPAGGIGIGIDRLVMFLTNQTSVREVILFPTMREK